jgi:hypothetical protein
MRLTSKTNSLSGQCFASPLKQRMGDGKRKAADIKPERGRTRNRQGSSANTTLLCQPQKISRTHRQNLVSPITRRDPYNELFLPIVLQSAGSTRGIFQIDAQMNDFFFLPD